MLLNNDLPSPVISKTGISSPQALPRKKGEKNLLKSIRTKALAFSALLGIVPIVTVGLFAFNVAKQESRTKAIANQVELTQGQVLQVSTFIADRFGDIQALANSPLFSSPELRRTTPKSEQSAILTTYVKVYGYYDSITFMDLQGNDLLVSEGVKPGNHREDDYVVEVVKTGKPFISQPRFNKSVNSLVIYFAAPVKDKSGNPIGIVRSRMPVKYLDDLLRRRFEDDIIVDERLQLQYHILDQKGQIFVAREASQQGNEDAFKAVPILTEMKKKGKVNTAEGFDLSDPDKQLITYAPLNFPSDRKIPDLGWSMFSHQNLRIAYQGERELADALLRGAFVTIILAIAIALYVTNQAIKPILAASETVEKMGDGNLAVRLDVTDEDEIGVLGSNINYLATQLNQLLEFQRQETEKIDQARQEARMEADALVQEQKAARELLQGRALSLLMEVDPVSRGDLTIRANVTEDEMGTIADSYNALIRSLRELVLGVQQSATTVTETTAANEQVVQTMTIGAQQQASSIQQALQQIQLMVTSLREVEVRAQQAQQQVQLATHVVEAGDKAMTQTVTGITIAKEKVSRASEKVQQLDEASQKIAKVVKLIGNFAAQTNLLALNASIEAARAGEEGQSFRVVAEEVRALAQRSSDSTREIRRLLEDVQSQVGEAVVSMAEGTEQVVLSTQLIESARQSLSQANQASSQANQLVQDIALATNAQLTNSGEVRKTMENVATIAENSSHQSENVAQTFGELLALAQNLQQQVSRFKVN